MPCLRGLSPRVAGVTDMLTEPPTRHRRSRLHSDVVRTGRAQEHSQITQLRGRDELQGRLFLTQQVALRGIQGDALALRFGVNLLFGPAGSAPSRDKWH